MALANFMRLSLLKAAHAVVSSAAWQEIRVRSGRDDNSSRTHKIVISRSMRSAARLYALSASWDAVFEGVYSTYDEVLASHGR